MKQKYIGCFECDSGKLVLCDPFTTTLCCEAFNLDVINKCHIPVTGQIGVWHVYQVLDDDNTSKGLLLQIKGEDITNEHNLLNEIEWNNLGMLCVSFGRMVSLVDKAYYNNSNYALSDITADVIYDASSILDWIYDNRETCEDATDYVSLIEFLNKQINNGQELVTGQELMDIIQIIPNNQMLGGTSNLWSNDCKVRLAGTDVATIKGGVVTKSDNHFVQCYANNSNIATSIYISLSPHDFNTSRKPISLGSKTSRNNLIYFPVKWRMRKN